MKRGRDFFQASEDGGALPLRRADQALVAAIIDEAKRRGIELTADLDLLATLASVENEAQIPRELYAAMAVVLSWMDQLEGQAAAGSAAMPDAAGKN